jgi:methyl-accepting chemotaxis protein
MNFGNLKIGTRLAVGFGFVAILLILLSTISVSGISKLNGSTETMVRKDWTKAKGSVSALDHALTSLPRVLQIATTTDANESAKEEARLTSDTAAFNNALESLEPALYLPEERAIFSKIKDARDRYTAAFSRVLSLRKEGKRDEAEKFAYGETYAALRVFASSLRELTDLQERQFDKTAIASNTAFENMRIEMVVLGVAALLLAIGFSLWITRSITRPINIAMNVAQAVAAGNLSSRIDVTTTDETGKLLQALKDMNDGLVRIVGEVRAGTETISTASREIAAGNLDLSWRTEQQASSLEETASSMEELTSTVKQNADNAWQANQLAASASGVALEGGAVVAEVVVTMASINASAKKIADIISVIDGIAFQTNILALNAAVEAARAGEQGRGFAVVASEVRNLAQRSAAAAKEIKTLISDSVEKVDAGSRLVDQAGATMGEIVESVKRVTDIMSEITAASKEQTSGIEQINQAITRMDEVTQQNAALVQQAAAAAESLHNQTGNLTQVVGVFKIIGSISINVASHTAPVLHSSVRHASNPASPRRQAVAPPRNPLRSRHAPISTASNASGDWEEF